jgi:hypothetical protein
MSVNYIPNLPEDMLNFIDFLKQNSAKSLRFLENNGTDLIIWKISQQN